jgi:plastocyanin
MYALLKADCLRMPGNKKHFVSSQQLRIMKFTIKNVMVAAAAAVSLWMMGQQSGFGASTTVLVGSGGLHFVPAMVTVSTGDSVIWSWSGVNHSTTSGTNGVHGDDLGAPSGSWDSGVFSPTHNFTNTFTSAGTFSYYCSVHFAAGMVGSIVVTAPSLPPAVSLISPQNGKVFAAPANINVQAVVTNGSGTVTNVQLLEDSSLLANVTTPPYGTTATGLAAGNYSFTAIAQDNNNLFATNTVSISVVTPVTVALTNVFELTGGTNFQFSYSANIGLNYVVSRSTDFLSWLPLATNMAQSNPVVFTDLTATNSLNFYRVGQLPNP